MAEQPSFAAQLAENPMVFGTAVGVVNGALAAARNKPVSVLAAGVTAVVGAVGEVALVMELPSEKRPNLWLFGLQSALGTLIGMAPFVSWTPGSKSWLQRAGEAIADKASRARTT